MLYFITAFIKANNTRCSERSFRHSQHTKEYVRIRHIIIFIPTNTRRFFETSFRHPEHTKDVSKTTCLEPVMLAGRVGKQNNTKHNIITYLF